MELPDVAAIERLTLKPGDRLVLSVDYQLSDAEFAALTEYVRGWGLPEGSVLIIDSGARLQVLEAARYGEPLPPLPDSAYGPDAVPLDVPR